MPSRPLPRPLLAALPVALAACALVVGGSAQAGGATLVGAAPTADPGDGRTARGFAVSFSPDGDGVRDGVRVAIRAPSGTRWRVVVTVAATEGATRTVFRGRAITAEEGLTRLTWDGSDGRRALSDGPYLLRVCAVGGGCLARTVAVHLRTLAAAIRSDRSYAPGELVPLTITADRPSLIAGIAPDTAKPGDRLEGAAALLPGRTAFRLPESIAPGLHRLVVTTGRPGAWRALPLLIRSRPLARPAAGTTLVVLPHLTWSVYNQYDADRDGSPDSHYQSPGSPDTPLIAPYEAPGLPAPGRAGREQDAGHTAGFMRTWRLLGGARRFPAQFATDADLERLRPAALRRYAAVLFLGHGEYYTRREFDLLRDYQLHGGDFLYASANGFYALVERRGAWVRVVARPQRTAALNDALVTGVQYTGCCWSVGSPGPLLVTRSGLRAAPWAFRGTGLRAGDVLAYAGGEIDGYGPQSPAGMTVLARIDWRAPDAPQSAAMVLLRRPGGGRVFSAGTMGFVAGTARNAVLRRVFGNVWRDFARR